MKKIRPWARFLVAAAALLLAASWGVSGALEHGWARRPLLARLSADFGRPVDVGSFAFTLLGGPRLEADSVTVAEDPRFGNEYFLRADQLTVGLRWSALFRGRVEFGTVSLTNPSLNLVRAADGHWNVESWLPPLPQHAGDFAAGAPLPANAGDVGLPSAATRHLGRIAIDGGRINFKLGPEKLLFALVDVGGSLDQDAAGRWNLDLEANPIRASVALQEAGTLHLRGTVAGTSARLRPARLDLTWDQASLADTLRLARGQDYGVRGSLSAELLAQIKDGDQWTIAGTLHLAGIHRWDLPARTADPAVNVAFGAAWRPGAPNLEIARFTMESAQSRLAATGAVNWSHGFAPSVQITDSRIDLADVLAWSRSFATGLPNALSATGAIALQASLAGWPLRLQQASLSAGGAALRPGGSVASAEPIRLGPISALLRRDSLVLAPVLVTLPAPAVITRTGARGAETSEPSAPAGTVLVEGALGPLLPNSRPRDWPYHVAVSGQTTRVQDLLALAAAFGRRPSGDWQIEGPVALQLAWSGVLRPSAQQAESPAGDSAATPSGTIDLRGVRVTTAILNRPLVFSAASIELRPGGRRVKLAQAEAFGGRWKGTLDWRGPERVWHFDLVADRLDTADLDRWLGPRARPSFFERVLPFTASGGAAPPRDAAVARLAAYGRLRVGDFALAGLHVERLDASADLAGRNLILRRAQGAFFDGRVIGDFEAHLAAEPSYSFRGQFDRVNLGALASVSHSLESRFAGAASGEVLLSARGVGRERLLATLAGQGDLRVREPLIRGLDLSNVPLATPSNGSDSPRSGATRFGSASFDSERSAGENRFSSAAASFHLAGGTIHLDQLSLTSRDARFDLQGTVLPSLALDLRVRAMPRDAAAAIPAADVASESDSSPEADEWAIGGTLDAPQLTRQTRLASDRAVARGPARH